MSVLGSRTRDEVIEAAPAAHGWRSLASRDWFLLVVLGATTLFDGYDRSIVALALPQIRHSFSLSQSEASLWLALVYLGSLLAVPLARAADRIGRQRLLIWTIVGFTAATALTALSPTMAFYVGCQFAAAAFLSAEVAVAWVLVAEELPSAARGFGFGWLAMTQALGTGLAAILYGGVVSPIGLSWRWMYVFAIPPLALVGVLRRQLPESRRFIRARGVGELAPRWHTILRGQHLRWLLLVVVTGLLLELTNQGSVFALDFLQTQRHLSASAANFLLVGAGLPGIATMLLAGSLSDRVGRRLVGSSFAAASLVGAAIFFWAPGGVLVLFPALTLVLVGQLGAWPALAAYSVELFPTALRGQAGSWLAVARVGGDASSLALGSVLIATAGGLAPAVSILAAGPLIAIVIVAVWFPDTHGRELEEITESTSQHSATSPHAGRYTDRSTVQPW